MTTGRRSRNPKKRNKQEMPTVLKELGEQATARHLQRSATPDLIVTKENGRWWFNSPFRKADEDHWVALLFDAFGTRSQGTFRTFMCQLAELCSTEWNEEARAWHPSEDELVAAVQIVRSTKPRNEAEACLAAQMVAVHVMQMKLSGRAVRGGQPDPRSCAVAGKLARTYAMQLETMSRLQGKAGRQKITVRKYEQHEHKHIHVRQGGSENGNQPHEARETSLRNCAPTLEPQVRPTLPRQNPKGNGVSVPCGEGANEMPSSRRGKRIRRAKGKS